MALANTVTPPASKVAPPAQESEAQTQVENQAAETQQNGQTEKNGQHERQTQETQTHAEKKPGAFGKEFGSRVDEAMGKKKPEVKEAAKVETKIDEGAITHELDDAALEKHIAENTQKMGGREKAAFSRQTYELRDLKRKIREADAQGAKVKELEAKLKEVEAKGGNGTGATQDEPSKVEALTKRLEEAEAILMGTKLEATQAWQDGIAKPTSNIQEIVKKIVAKYGDADLNKIQAALNNPDLPAGESLDDLISEFSERDRYKIFDAELKLGGIKEQEGLLRQKSSDLLAQEKAKAQTASFEHSQEFLNARKSAFDPNWDALAKDVPVLSRAEGEDDSTKAWNESLDDAAAFARETEFTKLDAVTQVQVMQRAAVFPNLVGTVQALQAALDAKVKELDAFKQVRPGAGRGRVGQSELAPKKDDSGFSFEKVIEKRMQEAGLK